MKTILLSTQSKWCEKIANREKLIEVRKSAPKEVPFKVLLYCTKGKPYIGSHTENGKRVFTNKTFTGESYYNGKIIGEFVCDKVEEFVVGSLRCDEIEKDACVSYSQMVDYFYKKEVDGKTVKIGYAWHISDLKIYDKPKELSEFSRPCSYSGLCFSCKRASFKKDGNLLCNTELTRPPQSWAYVKGE